MTEQLVSSKGEIKRMPLSIKGLDDNIGGGLPTGSIMLVCGPAGTMKSSLCFNSIYAEAEAKKNVLYITLEQSYVSLLNQMINMGYDFQKIDVTVIGSDPNIIKKKVKDIKAVRNTHKVEASRPTFTNSINNSPINSIFSPSCSILRYPPLTFNPLPRGERER